MRCLNFSLPTHGLAMSGFRAGVNTQDAGFQNASHFARVFRKLEDTGPSRSERIMCRGGSPRRLVHSEVVLINVVQPVNQMSVSWTCCSFCSRSTPQRKPTKSPRLRPKITSEKFEPIRRLSACLRAGSLPTHALARFRADACVHVLVRGAAVHPPLSH